MATGLLVVAGLSWLSAYGLLIGQLRHNRAIKLPLVVICVNLAWALVLGVLMPTLPWLRPLGLLWVGLDLIGLAIILWAAPHEHPELGRQGVGGLAALALGTSFGLILLLRRELGAQSWAILTLGQNLLLAIVFATDLLRRRRLHPRALTISSLRVLGNVSLALAILQLRPESALLIFLALATLGYDLLHLSLLVRLRATASASPVGVTTPSLLFVPRVPPPNPTISGGIPWYREN